MRRTIRLLKDAHPINSIMENAKKLELLQHRTLGKRHTLLHMTMKESLDTRPQIKTPRSVKEFENLVKNIPAVENTIEKELLEAMKSHLTPLEKEELDHSYRLRQAYTETKIYEPQPIPPTPEGDPELLKIDTDLYISDVPNVKAEEIGRFFEISKEKASKLFSSGYFGDYFKDTFARNCNLDIMMREETFNLINILRASQNIESKKMFPELQNYHHMNGLNHCEQYKWLLLNCLDSYLKVLRKSAYYLNETINEREDLKVRLLMKNSPEFFYQLCFIVMTELKDQNLHDLVFRQDSLEPDPYDSLDRSFAESSIKELFNEILTVVSSKLKDDDSLNQFRLRDYVKHIAPKFTFSFKGTEFTFNFEHYSIDSFKPKHPKEIQEIINNPQTVNVGSLLTGIKGNGKSQVLAGLSYWAATEGNWFVVKVPNGSDFTRNRTEIIWDKSGMYLQPEVAYDYLLDIYNTNKEKLEHIKIKKSVYGKYNLTGLHDEYDEAYKPITPHHTWIRDLRCYGDDWKQFYPPEIIDFLYLGTREFTVDPRRTKFEHEVYIYENRRIPDIFIQRWNNPNFHSNVSLNTILPIDCPKRKPKKRMLPDAPWENTRFTANPAQIHSQDLIIEEEKKGKKEEEEEEQLYDFENSTFDPKDLPTGTPVATRVGDKLPDAENFLQLIEFGLNNHVYCTNVICELLEQLYHTDDTNVLIVVDGYSEFFKPSAYPSVKYENFKPCQGKIPPHDIALSRAFMRFDGHMIKNGVKVVATSENTFVRDKNKCTGEHLFIDSGFEMSVPYLALNDFRKAVHHYRMTSWTFQEFDEPEIEDVYMMSQGNWTLAQQNLKFYNYELW